MTLAEFQQMFSRGDGFSVFACAYAFYASRAQEEIKIERVCANH